MKYFTPSNNRTWATASATGQDVWAHGHAFQGGHLFSGEALATETLRLLGQDRTFGQIMDGFSGQFALAAQQDQSLWLGSDAIRTVPLFYNAEKGTGSDEIALLPSEGTYVQDSVIEYAMAGFITGPHTLYHDIRTVQAGEIVHLENGQAAATEYYDLRNSYDDDSEDATVLARLDKVVMDCMERAATVCDGRQVVIPLSGGLDSRLILSSFKRLGYDNIICFSYGLKDNWEATKARTVADKLDTPWFPIEFTGEQLRRDYHSDEMRKYWRYAGQASTLPAVSEWPGVRLASLDDQVKPDAVFLSGQSGDFINGSHLKYLFDPEWHTDPLDVAGAIRSKHYSLWQDLAQREDVRTGVSRRITETLADFDIADRTGAAQAYEFWECRERQLKYVVQGGRVFDFFGHEWWMPLWDREIIDFFKPVSIGLKLNGYLYAKYLAEHDPFGIFQNDRPKTRFDREQALRKRARHLTPRRRLKAWLHGLPGVRQIMEPKRRRREHRHYYRHNPLGFQRIYSEEEYVNELPDKRHVLSLWLRDYLKAEFSIDIEHLEL